MRYCSTCGSPISDTARFCDNCGAPQAPSAAPAYRAAPAYDAPPAYNAAPPRDDTMVTVAKVFLVLGCISVGWALVPLAWCIPMTVSLFRKMDNREPIGIGLKVCTLLFVSRVAGILLLCMDE